MCGGVEYQRDGKSVRVYFPNPHACLPVITKLSNTQLLPWGRRRDQTGNLPLGGWARLESIKDGRWDKYFPKPVRLSLDRFMEKDIEGVSCWSDITAGQYIQGLLAHYDNERRVYVVTVTPVSEDAVHSRWPRLVNAI